MGMISLLEKYIQLKKELRALAGNHAKKVEEYHKEQNKIQDNCQRLIEQEREKFNQVVASIKEQRDKELKELKVPVMSDEYRKVVFESTAIRKELKNYSISSQQLCHLLEKETGLEWREKPIEGYINDNLFGDQLMRYGVALVNEKNMFFNSSSIYLATYNEPRNSSDVIICCSGGGWPEDSRNELQKKAEDFDWLDVFLVSEGIIDDSNNEITKRCGLYQKEIINAIKTYIKLHSAEKEEIEAE